jgi:hypothetical protein
LSGKIVRKSKSHGKTGINTNSRNWTKNNLTRELDLNRESKTKKIGYHRDVQIVIASIWNFKALAVFKSTSKMFYTILVINLLIDGASRIGEFLPATADAMEKKRFVEWGHLEFLPCRTVWMTQ